MAVEVVEGEMLDETMLGSEMRERRMSQGSDELHSARMSFVSEESDASVGAVKKPEAATRSARILAAWVEVRTVYDVDVAVRGLLEVMEALLQGIGPAHGIINNDVIQNVAKVRRSASALGAATVDEMVEMELAKEVEFRGSGREALLWLKRTLQFVWKTVYYALEDPSDGNLGKCVKGGYNDTLAHFHGFKAHAFRFMMNATPGKDEFFGRLGSSREEVVPALHKWLELSRPVVEGYVHLCNEIGVEHQRQCQVLV